jgi:hypothetical protein
MLPVTSRMMEQIELTNLTSFIFLCISDLDTTVWESFVHRHQKLESLQVLCKFNVKHLQIIQENFPKLKTSLIDFEAFGFE